jgi:hypothetical protein
LGDLQKISSEDPPSDKKIWIRVERSGVTERSSKNLKGNTWEKGELLEILGLRRDLEIFKLIDKCEDNKILKILRGKRISPILGYINKYMEKISEVVQ